MSLSNYFYTSKVNLTKGNGSTFAAPLLRAAEGLWLRVHGKGVVSGVSSGAVFMSGGGWNWLSRMWLSGSCCQCGGYGCGGLAGKVQAAIAQAFELSQ